jgi:ketosteroid isomerase-like protein
VNQTLPAVLERYYAAQNAHDIEALVACFAPDAVVHDEGEDIVGTAAIRAWKEKTSAKYQVTVEPLDCRDEAGTTIVVARVSGTFPGSPADLTYRFRLAEDGRINGLEIG